jgi:NtrC-family two-component system response regulator AlgB
LRELRNTVERAVILAQHDVIELKDLPAQPSESRIKAQDPSGKELTAGAAVSLETLEEAHIRKVLQWAGSLAEAAQVLGIDQATLYRRRKKLGLDTQPGRDGHD